MRRAIVLVDHGSRVSEANDQLEEIATLLRARLPSDTIAFAHMELAQPDLRAAIDDCVADGATEVVVVPFFLAAGRHSRRDIPDLVEEAALRHPAVALRTTDPLGVHPALVEVILDRLK